MNKTELYLRDGFYISEDSVLPQHITEEGVKGMDLVRKGEYDTGHTPNPSPWNPGDDPNALCKIRRLFINFVTLRKLTPSPSDKNKTIRNEALSREPQSQREKKRATESPTEKARERAEIRKSPRVSEGAWSFLLLGEGVCQGLRRWL